MEPILCTTIGTLYREWAWGQAEKYSGRNKVEKTLERLYWQFRAKLLFDKKRGRQEGQKSPRRHGHPLPDSHPWKILAINARKNAVKSKMKKLFKIRAKMFGSYRSFKNFDLKLDYAAMRN